MVPSPRESELTAHSFSSAGGAAGSCGPSDPAARVTSNNRNGLRMVVFEPAVWLTLHDIMVNRPVIVDSCLVNEPMNDMVVYGEWCFVPGTHDEQ